MDIKDLNNKIETNSNDINQIWDFLKDLKDDINIIFKNIKKDRTEDKLEKFINNTDDKFDLTSAFIKDLEGKIEKLENKYKYMFNNKDIEHLINKIDDLEKYSEKVNFKVNANYNKIEKLENDIKALYKLDRSNENAIIKVNNKYDDLESKYFKLLQAIDEIRKDSETITIKELRRFKDWNSSN